MATAPKSWTLFWLLALAISIANGVNIAYSNFSTFEGSQAAVVRTIWYALPWLVAAFLASSLARLWPGNFTRWLLANRRYLGLTFSAGMAWHLSVVTYFLSTFGNHLETRDLTLDVIGLLFLIAMTLTSFPTFRGRLSPSNWRRLHTVGVYVLWALPTFFFLEDYVELHEPVYAGAAIALLIAFALRVTGRIIVRGGLKPLRH
jgi:sulfoxide reductase heme-binding subunit YedZ